MDASDHLDHAGAAAQQAAMVRPGSVHRQILRAIMTIASATLLIRITGMGMQIVVTSRFGEGAAMDAYFIAVAVITLLGGVIASAIEAAVVPVYVRVRAQGDSGQTSRLFSTLLSLALLAATMLMALLLLFRAPVILAAAPAASPSVSHLATGLAVVVFPSLVLTIVLALLESILNAEGQFGWPAYAGLVVPFSMAVSVLVAGRSLGVIMLGIGTLIGLCLQTAAFIVRLRRAKLTYRPSLDLRNPALTPLARAIWPLLLGSSIGAVSPIIDQIFASALSTGSISAINYALKLSGVASGVIFIAVQRAALPYLSRQAGQRDMHGFKATLRLYLWLVGLSTILATASLMLLAHPLVRILFQRGAFSVADTNRTATTLLGFVVGLLPMGLGFLLATSFSALSKTRVLMFVSAFSMIANAIFDSVLSRVWQSLGIALATSAVYTCTLIILLFTLRQMIGRLGLLTPPPELVFVMRSACSRVGAALVQTRAADNGARFQVPDALSRTLVYVGVMIGAAATGVAVASRDALSVLRLMVGLPVIVVWLRYPYVLLLSWAIIDPFIGSNVSLFNGKNLDSAMTIPTLLLLIRMPIKDTFRRMPALVPLCGFLVCILLGITVSPLDIGTFLKEWLLFLDIAVVAVFAINVLSTRRRVRGLVDVMLVVTVVIALYGIYGYVTHRNVLVTVAGQARITSIYSYAPPLALLLSNVLPLALYRMFTARRYGRVLAFMAFCIVLGALGLTFTRGAMISVGLCFVVAILLLPTGRMKVGVLAVAALVILVVAVTNVSILDRFALADVTTLNGRTPLWHILLDHFDPSQLFGHGLNASSDLLAGLQTSGSNLAAVSASNLYVATLYDHGLTGLACLLLAFAVLAVGLIRGMRQASGEHRILFVAAALALVNSLIQSVEVSDLFTQSIGVYFFMIVALPFAVSWSRVGAPSETQERALPALAPTRVRRRAESQVQYGS